MLSNRRLKGLLWWISDIIDTKLNGSQEWYHISSRSNEKYHINKWEDWKLSKNII